MENQAGKKLEHRAESGFIQGACVNGNAGD